MACNSPTFAHCGQVGATGAKTHRHKTRSLAFAFSKQHLQSSYTGDYVRHPASFSNASGSQFPDFASLVPKSITTKCGRHLKETHTQGRLTAQPSSAWAPGTCTSSSFRSCGRRALLEKWQRAMQKKQTPPSKADLKTSAPLHQPHQNSEPAAASGHFANVKNYSEDALNCQRLNSGNKTTLLNRLHIHACSVEVRLKAWACWKTLEKQGQG